VRIGTETPLVLGSASPRRRELLATLDVSLIVLPADIDETVRPGETPAAYLERIAAEKLTSVLSALPTMRSAATPAGVLVADTIVIAPDGRLLGKPKTDEESREMIALLEGAVHEVATRFALSAVDSGHAALARTVTTRVSFRQLVPSEIDAYVSSAEGRDKAGAYAIQGRAAAFIESIEGSYTNVVGLPLCEVVVAMRALGWLS
jgi:nucleoside triphosphate pyrophosphatase